MFNPFPNQKKLDTFKLKEFANDNFKLDENGRKFSEWVENAVGKGEIARYARFVLSIAIVAKCNKKINVAHDFFIWRKCVATTFCQVT